MGLSKPNPLSAKPRLGMEPAAGWQSGRNALGVEGKRVLRAGQPGPCAAPPHTLLDSSGAASALEFHKGFCWLPDQKGHTR